MFLSVYVSMCRCVSVLRVCIIFGCEDVHTRICVCIRVCIYVLMGVCLRVHDCMLLVLCVCA